MQAACVWPSLSQVCCKARSHQRKVSLADTGSSVGPGATRVVKGKQTQHWQSLTSTEDILGSGETEGGWFHGQAAWRGRGARI